MNRKLLELREQQARLALDTMHRVVVDELPVGKVVDYNVGGRWIGPCRVTAHRDQMASYGPQIVVPNLKTGKERVVGCYEFVRPSEARP